MSTAAVLWKNLAPVILFVALVSPLFLYTRRRQLKQTWRVLRHVLHTSKQVLAEGKHDIKATWSNGDGESNSPIARSQERDTYTRATTEEAVTSNTLPRLSQTITTQPIADKQRLAVIGNSTALLYPLSLPATIDFLRRQYPEARFPLPYGWYLRKYKKLIAVDALDKTQEPRYSIVRQTDLAFGDLSDVNAVVLLGPQQYGKTSQVFNWFITLTMLHKPEALQFFIFDPKNLDFPQLANTTYSLAHINSEDAEAIQTGFKVLNEELKQRGEFLRSHKCSNWLNYHGNDALPLLIVYFSELDTLVSVMGQDALDEMLNSLMGRGAAYGIRVFIDTHALTNFATRWRNLITHRVMGPGMANPQHDQANANMSTEAIEAQGAVPPSKLRASHKGVFTVATSSGDALTVRMSFVDDQIRQRWFSLLPQKTPVFGDSDTQDQDNDSDLTIETLGLSSDLSVAIPDQAGLQASAAQLYQQNIELATILGLPHVREALKTMATSKTFEHSGGRFIGQPNIRKITMALFDIDNPSGEIQGHVKRILIELNLLPVKEVLSPMANPVDQVIAA